MLLGLGLNKELVGYCEIAVVGAASWRLLCAHVLKDKGAPFRSRSKLVHKRKACEKVLPPRAGVQGGPGDVYEVKFVVG